jgi:hypothetical protein
MHVANILLRIVSGGVKYETGTNLEGLLNDFEPLLLQGLDFRFAPARKLISVKA